jgi:hypothetical protein
MNGQQIEMETLIRGRCDRWALRPLPALRARFQRTRNTVHAKQDSANLGKEWTTRGQLCSLLCP